MNYFAEGLTSACDEGGLMVGPSVGEDLKLRLRRRHREAA